MEVKYARHRAKAGEGSKALEEEPLPVGLDVRAIREAGRNQASCLEGWHRRTRAHEHNCVVVRICTRVLAIPG